MYADITSCVIKNCYSTSLFNITRRDGKGCQLSPYLFILCVEFILIAIRTNKCIQGIKVGETEFD